MEKTRLFGRSLRTQILWIVLASMSVMLMFQTVSMLDFFSKDRERRQEYVRATNLNIVAALNAIGENVASIGTYMATYPSFQNLYLSRQNAVSDDQTELILSAFHTVRFVAEYFPIVLDVVIVDQNGYPFSYYSGLDYEFIENLDYDFIDPTETESQFAFLGDSFFVYLTPVMEAYSSVTPYRKVATCILLCDMDAIRQVIDTISFDETVNYSIYAGDSLVVSSNLEIEQEPQIITVADRIGLTVTSAGISSLEDSGYAVIQRFFVSSMILLSVITITVIIILHYRIARPISQMVKKTRNTNTKPIHMRFDKSHIEEIDDLTDSFNALLDQVEIYTRERLITQKQMYSLKLSRNEAEIYALQSQINPHFLYNVLQCIRSIAILEHVDEIAAVALSLSELFRYSMDYKDSASVRDEIRTIQNYIQITNIRYQERFTFHLHISEELMDYPMGRMLLQPLVENAVSHGVSLLEEGGHIEIVGRLEDNIISFEVRDNGPGLTESQLAGIRLELGRDFTEVRAGEKNKSFGLYNINRRLKLHYGEEYGLELFALDGITVARIDFPVFR